MNKPITVKQLLKICEQEIKNGNGDCSIMISRDDEGNDYHYLWYEFQKLDTLMKDYGGLINYSYNEEVAPLNKTILLG